MIHMIWLIYPPPGCCAGPAIAGLNYTRAKASIMIHTFISSSVNHTIAAALDHQWCFNSKILLPQYKLELSHNKSLVIFILFNKKLFYHCDLKAWDHWVWNEKKKNLKNIYNLSMNINVVKDIWLF